jgi:hypothetical protein
VPDQAGGADFAVSHGICKACKDYFFSGESHTLDKFLNQLEAPVLMVNRQGEVELANDRALQFLGKDLESVRGGKGGDVMECAYAKLPEGCGNTKHCVACTIRNNVMATFETGKSLERVPAFLNRLNRHTVYKIRFLISTERLGDVVLLRIDEVIEA